MSHMFMLRVQAWQMHQSICKCEMIDSCYVLSTIICPLTMPLPPSQNNLIVLASALVWTQFSHLSNFYQCIFDLDIVRQVALDDFNHSKIQNILTNWKN